ncbi:hypothetical protein CHUAL_012944 [Chamberlinius hualienensis]
MDILVVQTLCLCGLFLSTLILILLPLKIFGKSRSLVGKVLFGNYDNFISIANCLSGGVFLATFFVGLLPEVRLETVKLLKDLNMSMSIPLTEVIVLLGFFLALFIEQLAMNAKDFHKSKCKKRNAKASETDVSPSNGNVASQPLNDGGLYSSGVGTGTVWVHCLFEGIALGLQNEYHTLINLFIGIWIHECLIALALGLSMVRARPKPCRMWQIALFFSSLIPLGQVIGIVIGSSESWTSRVVSTILQGIAAGTFVQVTFLDVIPEGLGPVGSPKRLCKVGLLFLGFIIITAVSIVVETFGIHEHHH